MPEITNDEISHKLAATHFAFQYAFATLLAALAEKGAINPSRYFVLLQVVIDGFENGPAKPTEITQLVAEKLKDVEEAFRKMVAIPRSAGQN